MQTLSVKLIQRTDTQENWEANDPVLMKNEHGCIEGTGNYRIGDGETKWSDLPLYESLTSSDRSKLDSVAVGANNTIIDSAFSSTSTNPVQNKIINAALAGKAETNHTHDNYYNANVTRTANTVLAATNGSNGKATFRKLVTADLPSHTHDDRYYTETEINTKLGDLSSLSSYGSDVASILKAIIAKLPEVYSGSYDVTPTAAAQSLSTSGKVMEDDVLVSAIPYTEEANSSGTTVTIG